MKSAKSFRSLPSDNDYSLAAIERDLLRPNNLRFTRDESGAIADVTNSREGVEGSLAIETVASEPMTPRIAAMALDGAERAEKEYMKTGKREMMGDIENPSSSDFDFERAVIIANLLDGPSLELLASRGMHGKGGGDRKAKIDAVSNLMYRGSFGFDPYTRSPILGTSSDQGHLESNSKGGVRLRPEVSIINQTLTDTEGADRLRMINKARGQMAFLENAEKLKNDPDILRLVPKGSITKAIGRGKNFGYDTSDIMEDKAGVSEMSDYGTQSTKRRFASKPAVAEAARQTYGGSTRSESPGTNRERALIIEAGGDVNIGPGVLRSNGKNGNGNGKH